MPRAATKRLTPPIELPAFLTMRPRTALQCFLSRCAAHGGIDVDTVDAIATAAIANNRKGSELDPRHAELETRWYASLENGEPDYSVYEGDPYLGELWACWSIYSRSYLREIANPRSMPESGGVVADLGDVRRVVDLGCGFGYTTAALAALFPQAQVVGTNLPGTIQWNFAQKLGELHRFALARDVSVLGAWLHTDLMFASEYFEHQTHPVEHLREVLDAMKPRALLVANAFGTRSIGHFLTYEDEGETVTPKVIQQRFATELRRRGYEKQKTGLWNNRPQYWKRSEP